MGNCSAKEAVAVDEGPSSPAPTSKNLSLSSLQNEETPMQALSRQISTALNKDPSNANFKGKVESPMQALSRQISMNLRKQPSSRSNLRSSDSKTKTMGISNSGNEPIHEKFKRPMLNKKMSSKHLFNVEYERPIYTKTVSQKELLNGVLDSHFIFSGLGEIDREHLFDACEKIEVDENEQIITEGAVGDYCYVIEEGKVDFFSKGKKLNSYGAGKTFGDLALIYNSRRRATAISSEACILWRLDQLTYRRVLANNAIDQEAAKRDRIEKIDFLQSIDVRDRERIAVAASTRKVCKGTTIIKKGAADQDFYVIHEGSVRVEDIEDGGRSFEDQLLGPGEYFGELSSLRQTRIATVYAEEDTILFAISKEASTDVVGALKEAIMKHHNIRRLKAIPKFSASDVTTAEYESMMSNIQYETIQTGKTILKEKSESSGAIYLVRKGAVTITSSEDSETLTVTEGGYFGEDTMHMESYTSKKSAIADCKTEIGVINFKAIQAVIQDMSRLGPSASIKKVTSSIDRSIQLEDLKKHRMLGRGTFGDVWLVSHTKKDSNDQMIYALKVQNKKRLVKLVEEGDDVKENIDDVKREAQIMSVLDNPFLIRLVSLFQDEADVMMLLHLVSGGDLEGVMKSYKRFKVPEPFTIFYTSCILEGLSHMHSRKIAHRDIKPENVMIDADGYGVIVDMGFAKMIPDKTFTLCGSPAFLAPEVLVGRGHDCGCDYWSWACLVHEMLTGLSPFHMYKGDQMNLFNAIIKGRCMIIASLSAYAKDMLKKIFVCNTSLRLGCMEGGISDIKNHPWLAEMDFEMLVEKGYETPWKPPSIDVLGLCAESEDCTMDSDRDSFMEDAASLTQSELDLFEDFDYIL